MWLILLIFGGSLGFSKGVKKFRMENGEFRKKG